MDETQICDVCPDSNMFKLSISIWLIFVLLSNSFTQAPSDRTYLFKTFSLVKIIITVSLKIRVQNMPIRVDENEIKKQQKQLTKSKAYKINNRLNIVYEVNFQWFKTKGHPKKNG